MLIYISLSLKLLSFFKIPFKILVAIGEHQIDIVLQFKVTFIVRFTSFLKSRAVPKSALEYNIIMTLTIMIYNDSSGS